MGRTKIGRCKNGFEINPYGTETLFLLLLSMLRIYICFVPVLLFDQNQAAAQSSCNDKNCVWWTKTHRQIIYRRNQNIKYHLNRHLNSCYPFLLVSYARSAVTRYWIDKREFFRTKVCRTYWPWLKIASVFFLSFLHTLSSITSNSWTHTLSPQTWWMIQHLLLLFFFAIEKSLYFLCSYDFN